MANALYDKARESFLKGEIVWGTDDIRAVLVDTATYTVDLVNDQFLSDIPAGERVATLPSTLTSMTTTSGVADAADITFSSVTGDQSEAVVLYKYNASDAAARLIAYIDTATGLPVTPNGGDITVTWDSGANKIFKL